MKSPFLRGDENPLALQAPLSDDDAVVERHRHPQRFQMRAGQTCPRVEPFGETVVVAHAMRTRTRRRFQIAMPQRAGREQVIGFHAPPSSSICAAWESRKFTTAGVAPLSLIVMRVLASGRAETKLCATALHVFSKPCTDV